MEPTQQMLCFSLYAASRATTKVYSTLLEPHGLTYPQYLVLVLLWSRDARSVRDLGDALDLDSGTLSPLLRRMEQAGLVERSRRGADERVVHIALTDRGRALRAELADVPRCVADGMRVDRASGADLIASLANLADGMRETAAELRDDASRASHPQKEKA